MESARVKKTKNTIRYLADCGEWLFREEPGHKPPPLLTPNLGDGVKHTVPWTAANIIYCFNIDLPGARTIGVRCGAEAFAADSRSSSFHGWLHPGKKNDQSFASTVDSPPGSR